jgi:diguanylate cyclase (GGDEF)-like protein
VTRWLVPLAPEAIRGEVERRQLASIRQHVPMIYLMASLNVLIVMAVCAHTDVPPLYWGWMAGLVGLALVRTRSWSRSTPTLTPEAVSAALRGTTSVAFFGLLGLGSFTTATYVSNAFGRSTLIPISLAFGSMSIAHCFATHRPSAVAALTLGIVPSSVALIVVGDFNAQVLGVSMLSVAVLMIHFVAGQFDHLVTELQLQREVHALANTDALTNLLNRRALVTAIDARLALGPDQPFALALLDLDGFKGVNDRLGHLAGDDLLRVVGQRLAASCSALDTVARLGGDEFVVVLAGVGDDDQRRSRVERLLTALCQPTELRQESVPVQASLGAALFPRDGRTTADLLAAADEALYANKRERTRTGERREAPAPETGDRRRHRA